MSSKNTLYLLRKTGFGLFLFGILLHTALFFLFLCAGNEACMLSADPSALTPAVGFACYLLSAVFSGFLIARRASRSKVGYAMFVAFAFVMILLLIGVIMERGALPISVLINHGAYVMTSMIGGLLGAKKNAKKHHG